MKINKKKPKHWLILVRFTLNTLISLIFRLLSRNNEQKKVLLYGHKFNGNLKALYEICSNNNIVINFLTIDRNYYNELKTDHINILYGLSTKDMITAGQSSLIISDHGLHSLIILLKLTDIKFIDVWHGIPFKGFDKYDFKVQQQYNEIWVTSKLLKKIYNQKFGFEEKKIKTIGYTRTDILINKNVNTSDIKKSIGIPDAFLDKKIILFAPTWTQDHKKRNIFPFQHNEISFLQHLNQICQTTDSICLLRKHLNTSTKDQKYPEYIFDCSYAKFPNAESILLISDLLVCDWSSIAFDYLLLERPTIFLNVPAPFIKGFSLDKDYRFGNIVSTTEEFFDTLNLYLLHPEKYTQEYEKKYQKIRNKLYDNLADGQASQRALSRIQEYLNL